MLQPQIIGCVNIFAQKLYLILVSKCRLMQKLKFLEKDLDCAPTMKKLNESELTSDFHEFFRRMHLKQNFQNESENFSEVLVFAGSELRKKKMFCEKKIDNNF